ncbi:hypothetical protein [Kitasatospora sp. NPDC001175]|uniref:hypothetical protein n=1 Tax=Kitasatospora sp. NPDC001175 TaxID=3157103 RepID=UPI003D067156
MNPAATLVLAAGKLRLAAENANRLHPAPWKVDGRVVRSARDYIVVDRSTAGRDGDLDIALVAMMHPGAALAFADWLEDAAEGDACGEVNPYAVAVAQQILGREGSRS